MSDLATNSSEYIKELEERVDALREEAKSLNKRNVPMLSRRTSVVIVRTVVRG